ncbi:MAG: hypothetical protein HKO59_17330 [Phycisphaerales bacterium]|nr:hypothetical protein [Phycisphaerae bacterium]NNF42737.1 hypothetical protein [Phycisphaerales bacterium]NNM27712.1 hypothetical protein [Phycisphaerales bacterium]
MRFRVLIAASIAFSTCVASLHADVVDPESETLPVLRDLVEPLGEAGVDVLYSHESEPGTSGPSFGDAPRVAPLLGLQAWPGVDLDLDRHGQWLDAFETGARGAVAAVETGGTGARLDRVAFHDVWKDAADGSRVVITFAAADHAIAERVADVLEGHGYAVYLAMAVPEKESLDPAILGRMFVEADHCLAIDTASARLNPIIQFEAELLAELRRQHAWLADGASGLPPVRRGPMDVIESLGMLPIEVVPGGIVLGQRPKLPDDLTGARPMWSGSDFGIEVGGEQHVLEQVSEETRDSIAAFVRIPESHSVVDIAGGSVTLAAPFDGTRIGRRMTTADRKPFDHLSVRGAQKSLIVDEGVTLRRDENGRVGADVTLEVRFYRQDADGHADRLASLRFTVEDATGDARLLDLAWSRRPDHRIGFDGDGVEQLTDDLEQLALDAALIAVMRLGVGS